MTVKDIMLANFEIVEKVIDDLPKTFDSHDFIRRFSKEIEVDYVYLLASSGTTEPFQKVNMQIGKFLSNNHAVLGIISRGKVFSENVFGNNTECEGWSKV